MHRNLIRILVALSVALGLAPIATAHADDSQELNGGVEISPQAVVDLGQVAVGETVTVTWTVTNTSGGPNLVEFDPATVVRCDGAPNEPFEGTSAISEGSDCAVDELTPAESATPGCADDPLEPGASCEWTLSFVPEVEGTYYPTGHLTIYAEEPWVEDGPIFRIADLMPIRARVFADAPEHTPSPDPNPLAPAQDAVEELLDNVVSLLEQLLRGLQRTP